MPLEEISEPFKNQLPELRESVKQTFLRVLFVGLPVIGIAGMFLSLSVSSMPSPYISMTGYLLCVTTARAGTVQDKTIGTVRKKCNDPFHMHKPRFRQMLLQDLNK